MSQISLEEHARIFLNLNPAVTMTSYCRAKKLHYEGLRYQIKRAKKEKNSLRSDDHIGRFVPMQVEQRSAGSPIVIKWNELEVEVRHGFDPNLLQQVLITLKGC